MRIAALVLFVGAFVLSGCSRAPEYELRGQVLRVDTARQEITVKHQDIPGLMSAMTMPFKVQDASLLERAQPGDLITATLVVRQSVGYLTTIDVNGRAPLAEPAPPRPAVDVLNPGDEVPDVTLVDQGGVSRRLSEWRGRVLAVTFVYTRCPLPDFCPAMDRQFAAVQRDIDSDDTLKHRMHLLSVSFDPTFDTPAVLAQHASRVGARPEIWTYATGDVDQIDAFGARFGVTVMRDGASAGEILHNLRTAVIDAHGRLRTTLSATDWSSSELIGEMRNAVGAR